MQKKLTGKAMLLFCLGDFSRAIFNGLTATYLMYLFIPGENSSLPLLLPYGALTFALIRGIGVIFDALIDPLIASRSDNCHSKLGARIPFLRFASIPMGVFALLMVFMPLHTQSWVNAVWLLVMLLLFNLTSSLFLVPYYALMAELVTDTNTITARLPPIQKTTGDAFRFLVYAVPDHVWSEPTVTLPATCETAGSAYETCILCGITTPAEQPALGHAPEKTEAAAPTATAAGHIEYWTCSRCGKQFFDEAATQAVEDPAALVLPALAPEAETDGCPVCGKTHDGGMFDRLTGWFHALFHRIRSFFEVVC